jgi:asparagine synthase (glutamine-hydrolysing)
MRRRGPDADGFSEKMLSDGTHIQFLHSRLAILDLDSRSNQPYSTESSTIAMNGEIYNFVEIRSELCSQGYVFHTTGDTEVAIRTLEVGGPEAISRFEAMFAFAWLDHQSETVVLARDFFGEKPLFFLKARGGIYFGSTPQYVLLLSGQAPKINKALITRYLVNGYKDIFKHDNTFLNGIQRIKPGFAEVRSVNGGWESIQFKRPTQDSVDETMTFEEAVKGTLDRVIHAIDIRLRADVPIALCLSGGIDSNLILGVTSNVLEREVTPFSIVGSDPRYDESEAIAASAREFGTASKILHISEIDALAVIEEMTLERGSPVATANQFALWMLMREISQDGFRVTLSGVGADELFTGYYDHHLYYLYELGKENVSLETIRRNEWEEAIVPLVRNPRFRAVSKDPWNSERLRELVFGESRDRINYLTAGAKRNALNWADANFSPNLLRNRMANELWHETVPLLLSEEDQNAMFWSVENRSPYLDSRLLRWSQKVPMRHFIREGRAKALLRAAGKGIVPNHILDNPKKTGFNLSITDLLPKDRRIAIDYVADSGLLEIVTLKSVKSILSQPTFNDSDNKFAFSLISSAAFMRVHSGV